MHYSKEDAIQNALISSKIYNMFRTWLYIAKQRIEDGAHYKRYGGSLEEYILSRTNKLDDEDEIEFRQVLNHPLNVESLVLFGKITEEEYNNYNSCVDPYVSMYQTCIVPLNKLVQEEFLYEYMPKT